MKVSERRAVHVLPSWCGSSTRSREAWGEVWEERCRGEIYGRRNEWPSQVPSVSATTRWPAPSRVEVQPCPHLPRGGAGSKNLDCLATRLGTRSFRGKVQSKPSFAQLGLCPGCAATQATPGGHTWYAPSLTAGHLGDGSTCIRTSRPSYLHAAGPPTP